MLYAIIGMLVIIADQYSKFWVQGHIALTSTGEEFIPGILSLANVHNDGAAFGFLAGSGARIPFIILAGVFTVAVIIALATKLISGKLARWSIVLVTAGALSNCLDRVLYGYVQDMFKLEFINFPVFNLADVFITVFSIIFALAVIFGKTRRDDDDDYEFEDDEEEEEEIRPVSRRKQKRSKRRSRNEDVDEEEDEDEDEEPVRARRQRKPKRTGRAAVEEDEDEEDEEPVKTPARRTAQQSARQQRAAATATRPAARVKAAEDEDPFAGWERGAAEKTVAEEKTQARAKASTAARQRAAAPAPASSARATDVPAARTAARPTASAQAASKGAQARTGQRSTAAAPATASGTARPAAKPAPKPAVEEEYSLDDILNEFR